MNAVLDKANPMTSIAADDSTASVTRAHGNIERHVANVAKQVDLLIQPIMTTWPWPGSFPGQDQLVDAADLLSHLCDESSEWDQERLKPSTGDLLLEVQASLEQAIEAINTQDAIDGHDARRLLTREALNRTKAACCWCTDAHARVDDEVMQETAIAVTAPAPAPAPADPRVAQHAKAFGGIALQASILLQLVDSACSCTDTSDLHDALDATRIIVASIGSLADGFNDESVRGNQYGWHLGENIGGGAHA